MPGLAVSGQPRLPDPVKSGNSWLVKVSLNEFLESSGVGGKSR